MTKQQLNYSLYTNLMRCVYVSRSVLSDSATPRTVAHKAPLSMGFSRQEYWSGLPFPSPGDLPYPGIEPRSPTLWPNALTSEPPGRGQHNREGKKKKKTQNTCLNQNSKQRNSSDAHVCHQQVGEALLHCLGLRTSPECPEDNLRELT